MKLGCNCEFDEAGKPEHACFDCPAHGDIYGAADDAMTLLCYLLGCTVPDENYGDAERQAIEDTLRNTLPKFHGQ